MASIWNCILKTGRRYTWTSSSCLTKCSWITTQLPDRSTGPHMYPEDGRRWHPNGYRTKSLLNTDYNILAWVLARRLRQVMAEQLQHTILWSPGQLHAQCGIARPGRNWTRREHRYLLCILTLNFHNAFDRIAHDYLFYILQTYRIRQNYIDQLVHCTATSLPQ
jgi:hypothetical protein